MATNAGEYNGTEGSGGNADPILGSSIDPATIGGSGTGDGDVDGTGATFDPAIHIGRDKRNADGSYRRKRQRKSGGGAGASKASASAGDLKASVEMLSQTLLLLHVGMATSTGTPELALDKSESDLLAKATVNVLDQFDVTPDPKIQAIAGLIIAAGTVYGPRVYLIRERAKEEAKKPQQSSVVDFPPPTIHQ